MAAFAAALLKLHPATAIAQGPRQEYRQLHLGVEVRLVIATPDRASADAAARAAYAAIAELEQVLSDWRPTSEVRRLAERPGQWVPVSEPLFAVLEAGLTIAQVSQGAFDPTVGPLVLLWRDARARGALPADSAIARAKKVVGWQHVQLDVTRRAVRLDLPGMRLDFGGIAKGYILDSARTVLRSHGFRSVLLEAGGDVALGDAPPGETGWTVAITTPTGEQLFTLDNVSIGTSGPGAQFFEVNGVRYSHVIDPRTGMPLTNPTQATVIHTDGRLSDALSTTVTILGEARGTAFARWLDARAVYVSEHPAP